MNLHLTPEQERIVIDELKSGRFESAEEVIAHALAALREKEASSRTTDSNGHDQIDVHEMISFVEKNRTGLQGIAPSIFPQPSTEIIPILVTNNLY